MNAAFYQWFLAGLLEALRSLEVSDEVSDADVVAPAPDRQVLSTSDGVALAPGQSLLTPRPRQVAVVARVANAPKLLGDGKRFPAPLLSSPQSAAVTPVVSLPPLHPPAADTVREQLPPGVNNYDPEGRWWRFLGDPYDQWLARNGNVSASRPAVDKFSVFGPNAIPAYNAQVLDGARGNYGVTSFGVSGSVELGRVSPYANWDLFDFHGIPFPFDLTNDCLYLDGDALDYMNVFPQEFGGVISPGPFTRAGSVEQAITAVGYGAAASVSAALRHAFQEPLPDNLPVFVPPGGRTMHPTHRVQLWLRYDPSLRKLEAWVRHRLSYRIVDALGDFYADFTNWSAPSGTPVSVTPAWTNQASGPVLPHWPSGDPTEAVIAFNTRNQSTITFIDQVRDRGVNIPLAARPYGRSLKWVLEDVDAPSFDDGWPTLVSASPYAWRTPSVAVGDDGGRFWGRTALIASGLPSWLTDRFADSGLAVGMTVGYGEFHFPLEYQVRQPTLDVLPQPFLANAPVMYRAGGNEIARPGAGATTTFHGLSVDSDTEVVDAMRLDGVTWAFAVDTLADRIRVTRDGVLAWDGPLMDLAPRAWISDDPYWDDKPARYRWVPGITYPDGDQPVFRAHQRFLHPNWPTGVGVLTRASGHGDLLVRVSTRGDKLGAQYGGSAGRPPLVIDRRDVAGGRGEWLPVVGGGLPFGVPVSSPEFPGETLAVWSQPVLGEDGYSVRPRAAGFPTGVMSGSVTCDVDRVLAPTGHVGGVGAVMAWVQVPRGSAWAPDLLVDGAAGQLITTSGRVALLRFDLPEATSGSVTLSRSGAGESIYALRALLDLT
mgnify:CR=1 FL=1